MSDNNGNGIPIIQSVPSEESKITFVFGRNGDLARIDGNVNMNQLLIVSFEASQLAAGIRGGMMMQQMQNAAALAKVAQDLKREQNGRK